MDKTAQHVGASGTHLESGGRLGRTQREPQALFKNGTLMLSTTGQTDAYYTAAILGLRALDAAEPRARRFGDEAEARWGRFRGALHQGDRLEMLLRDAAAVWGVAFAAAQIFRLPGVATDEPFGPAWSSLNTREADRYLAADAPPTLLACAQILGVTPAPVALPPIRPVTRLVIAGGAAILAAADAFAGRDELDWAAQVSVVADDSTTRQLAGLASLFVGALRPCAVIASDEYSPIPGAVPVVSDDAEFTCTSRLS